MFVPASYGFTNWKGAFTSNDSVEQGAAPLLAFLDKQKIAYTTDFSQANWTYRIKLSKSKDNVAKIMRLQK